MAGGINQKDPRKKQTSNQFFAGQNSPEYTKQAQNQSQNKPRTFGLSGILDLNQSAEISQSSETNFAKELYQPSHLEKESNLLFSQEKEELKKAINELITQIKKLSKSAKNTKKEVSNAILLPTLDNSLYQINFLQRLKNFLKNVTKNVNEAGEWMEMFAIKCKQRGKFWDRSKKLGQQYMFSGEHSASRSAG